MITVPVALFRDTVTVVALVSVFPVINLLLTVSVSVPASAPLCAHCARVVVTDEMVHVVEAAPLSEVLVRC